MAAYTTIDDPEAYFQTQNYTANGTAIGSGGLTVTFDGTTAMQPDLVTLKMLGDSNLGHYYDSVRGVTKLWYEQVNSTGGTDTEGVTSFNSDGFTIGNTGNINTNDTTLNRHLNRTKCWKAGTTSGITTDGNTTITPGSYSFNQTAGFSIIQYTGNQTQAAKLAHGLGAVPHYWIMKSVSDADDWFVYHHKNTAAPETDFLVRNETAATVDEPDYWQDTAPNSVNITLGDDTGVNESGDTHLAYVWSEKQGYSKFGSYEGNGNADGTFVYTGFRPAYIMTKSIDSTSDWHRYDHKGAGYNPANYWLNANNQTPVEVTTVTLDILSNGFKMRTASDPNVAETYIYVAFAYQPFVNSEGVPCNAR